MPIVSDVIITWGMSDIRAEWKTRFGFTRPVQYISLPTPDGQHYGAQIAEFGPNPVLEVCRQRGIHPLRVMVCGFSESCQGVRAMVASKDGLIIEHAIYIDGIHCSWSGDGKPNQQRSNIAPSCLGPIIAQADLAARGPVAVAGLPAKRRYCTITHSGIVPPTYPSTTDTARAILDKLFASGWPVAQVPAAMRSIPTTTINGTPYNDTPLDHWAGQLGLTVLGYKNLSPDGKADHIYQGNMIYPAVIQNFLVPRWNSQEPTHAATGDLVASQSVGTDEHETLNPDDPLVVPDQPTEEALDWQKYYTPQEINPTPWWQPFLWAVAIGGTVSAAGALVRYAWNKHTARAHNPAGKWRVFVDKGSLGPGHPTVWSEANSHKEALDEVLTKTYLLPKFTWFVEDPKGNFVAAWKGGRPLKP